MDKYDKNRVVLATVLIITPLTVEVYAINITAFIHFNEQAIKEDSYGGDLDDVRFTVDGNYSGTYYACTHDKIGPSTIYRIIFESPTEIAC